MSTWPIFTTASGQQIAFNMDRALTVHAAPSGATIDFGNDYYITVAESFDAVVAMTRSQV